MDKSIFIDKLTIPNNNDLIKSLGKTYILWQEIMIYVHLMYPNSIDEWKYSGEKYGWSFKIKDKKRAIIYFLPRDNYFKVAFVFGQKATDIIIESDISLEIKNELEQAKKYAEGRGIRIDITNNLKIGDIKKLINIKLEH